MQLAGFGGKEGVDNNYPYIREAQASALGLPATAMVTAMDVGEADDIHPRWKRPVGERLAAAALTEVYNEAHPYRGPVITSVTPEEASLVVEFENFGGALQTTDGMPPRAFEVAANDGVYRPASARIEGPNRVVVSASDVSDPQHVRYAWTGYADLNLVNEDELPAFPYRSDTKEWSR